MGNICTFLGHRDASAEVKSGLAVAVRKLIIENRVDTFWLGGHGNFDNYAAQILRKLKAEFPHIQLILILAYPQQLQKFDSLLPFDGFDYPADAQATPYKYAISARNRYMVKNADFVISYVWKEYGGAYEALKIAQNNNKTIINLAQKTGS